MSCRLTTCFLAVLLAVVSCRGVGTRDMQGDSPFADVRVASLAISSFDTAGAEAVIRITATANRTAQLKSLTFEQLTMNGVPIQMPPITTPITLQKGRVVDGLPLLRTRLTYDSLDSLDPLRRLVRDGSARVTVVVRGQLRLSLFQQLALFTGDAWVVFRVDENVLVDIPGGSIGRLAGLAALTAAEPVWLANAALRSAARTLSDSLDQTLPALRSSVVALETRYQLRSRSGDMASVRHWSSAFVIGDGLVIAPAEAIEPWEFDPDVAEALSTADVTLTAPAFEIIAVPAVAAGQSSFSSRDGSLQVVKRLRSTTTVVSPMTKRRFSMRFRGHETNAALLRIQNWKGTALALVERPRSDWQPAVIIVPRWHNGRVEPTLRHTTVAFESGRYRLRDALDAAAFGSPVWIGTGTAGLLQDENSAASVAALLRRLR